VVRRDELKEFFQNKLKILGLNEKEINDFTKALIPK